MNIEPTEEQMQAARDFMTAPPSGETVHAELARLLAEREAKLRDCSSFFVAKVGEQHKELIAQEEELERRGEKILELRARVAELERPNWLMTPTRSTRSRKDRLKEAREREETLRARVEELEASVAAFHKAWVGAERDFNAQVKRVAELEAFQSEWQQKDGNTPGYNLQKAKNYGAQAYEWKQKAIKLEEREAQHLADIKALKGDAVNAITDLLVFARRAVEQGYIVDGDDAFGPAAAFLAHYDDAKADAPASTEGEATDE